MPFAKVRHIWHLGFNDIYIDEYKFLNMIFWMRDSASPQDLAGLKNCAIFFGGCQSSTVATVTSLSLISWARRIRLIRWTSSSFMNPSMACSVHSWITIHSVPFSDTTRSKMSDTVVSSASCFRQPARSCRTCLMNKTCAYRTNMGCQNTLLSPSLSLQLVSTRKVQVIWNSHDSWPVKTLPLIPWRRNITLFTT